MEAISNNLALLQIGQEYTLFPTPVFNKQYVGSLAYLGEQDKGYCFVGHEDGNNVTLFFGKRDEVMAYATDALNQTGLQDCE